MTTAIKEGLSENMTSLIINSFIQIGLTDQHALIYIANMTLGRAVASRISKWTKIPRSTTYAILNELEEWGFIQKVNPINDTKTYFICNKPKVLEELVTYKKDRINDISYQLEREIYSLESLYYKNFDEPFKREFQPIRKIESYLQNAIDQILSSRQSIYIWLPQYIDSEMIEILNFIFIENQVNKHSIKLLIQEDADMDILDELDTNKTVELKFTSDRYQRKDTSPFILMTGNHTFFINSSKQSVLTIEDKETTLIHRSMFEYFWDNPKDQNTDYYLKTKG